MNNLDSMENHANESARDWVKEGEIYREGKKGATLCKRKITMPTNKCPFCKSTNTWHKICKTQHSVWRFETVRFDKVTELYKKWDFCFKCQREFLIEAFVWIDVSDKVRTN